MVKVLCYNSKGRWFDSRWCHWNFSSEGRRQRGRPEVNLDKEAERAKKAEEFKI